MTTWFYSGTYMKDGTPITIEARSDFVRDDCVSKGLKPLRNENGKKPSSKSTTSTRPIKKRARAELKK